MPTLDAQQQSQQQQIVQQPSRATGPSPPSGQHQQNDTVRQCQELPGRRVFVGGLTDETTMADLLTHFEQFGQIHEVKKNLYLNEQLKPIKGRHHQGARKQPTSCTEIFYCSTSTRRFTGSPFFHTPRWWTTPMVCSFA